MTPVQATARVSLVTNRHTGERVEFLTDRSDLVVAKVTLPPRLAGAPPHHHATMVETFTVLTGVLHLTVDGTETAIPAGGAVTIQPGTVHAFRNATDQPVEFTTTNVRPGRFAWFLRTWHGLANDGRSFASGVPRSPFALMTVLGWADFWFPGVPRWCQRGLSAPIRMLAWMMGTPRRLAARYVDGGVP